MSSAEPVRLSGAIVFVDYGAEVELQHTVRGTTCRVDRPTYEDLLRFRSYRPPGAEHERWVAAGVLVPAFREHPRHQGGVLPGTEARLAEDYQDWYWRHEVESERDYRWLGRSVLKMPTDLFFYQELIAANRIDSVLEIGSGEGGGLWFFATILALLGGGTVVGVERELTPSPPGSPSLPAVRVHVVEGDAHDAATVESAQNHAPAGFGLVVIDADPTPAGKLALLRGWLPLVAPQGFIVLEDIASPLCRAAPELLSRGLDELLRENPQLESVPDAARHPFLKARGAVLRRGELTAVDSSAPRAAPR